MAQTTTVPTGKLTRIFIFLKQAINGQEMDYTIGNIRKAVLMLAVPMILEMCMESVFAVVDLYFVGHLKDASHAMQTVGLTESVLTIIYSLAIGMSMAATALVARRIGEKEPAAAAHAGAQAILVSIVITILISVAGYIYAADLLHFMGATAITVTKGTGFVRIMMGSSVVIMLLYLINGIFRGAGNAAMAMRSLWLANGCNIILCPLLINGLGPIPAMGLEGAAWATVIGRGSGVIYQLYHLLKGSNQLKIKAVHWQVDWPLIASLVKIAAPGILQFIIGSCSWIFLSQLVAKTGGDIGSAGYQTAIRLMMFFLLPAWGLSNAAATLVGQNLGAKQLQRAEDAVKITIRYNVIFMAAVTAIFWLFGQWFVSFFTTDESIRSIAVQASRIMASGYIFYGIGMVLMNAFNGAGDTWTPTVINFCIFWLIQIPLAYFLATQLAWGPLGVFLAIPIAETILTITSYIVFKKGRWKHKKI